MAKKPARKSDDELETVIVRDPTFMRVVADNVFIVNLGRDYELSFLQVSSEPESMAIVDENGRSAARFDVKNIMTEVVRVRMSPDSVLQMSMNLLEKLIAANQVVNEKLLEGIQSMIENAQSEMSE